jgi:hypothetical protein
MLNRFMERTVPTEISVGMGATLYLHTDRIPYVITDIERFKTGTRAGQVKAVHARRVEVTGERWPQGDAAGIHLDRPYGATRRFAVRKDGRFSDVGGSILGVGRADFYRDPSF